MWGGLRQSLANAAVKGAENIQNSGGLIAKIGQVVAPQESAEEDEQEYHEQNSDQVFEEEYDDEDVYEEYDEEITNTGAQGFGGVGKFLGGVMKATASRITATLEHPELSSSIYSDSAIGTESSIATQEHSIINHSDITSPAFHQVEEKLAVDMAFDEQQSTSHSIDYYKTPKEEIQYADEIQSPLSTPTMQLENLTEPVTTIANDTTTIDTTNLDSNQSHINTQHQVDYMLYHSLKLEKESLVSRLQDSNQLLQKLQLEMFHLQQDTQQKLQFLTQTHEEEINKILHDSTLECQRLQEQDKHSLIKHTEAMADKDKKHAIALDRLDNKLARALADKDERESEIDQLKRIVTDLRVKLQEAAATEQEADELDLENEELHKSIQSLQHELEQVKLERRKLEEEQTDLFGVRMELELLKEENNRLREKNDAALEAHSNNYNKIINERDEAKAQAVDLEQQLVAVSADLNISQADILRLVAMNNNLQKALEAFQVERETELALWEEAKNRSEQAILEAHKTELRAVMDSHKTELREIQYAADKAINNMMQELSATEKKVDEYRKESITTRRSLDEAIHQLQRNQEDVIDRSVIKNILIDWHTKSGKAKRDVMHLLSSLLHFSDEDKEKCGLGSSSGSLAEKVAVAVVPPLPSNSKSIDQLEGDTVRDKFVNFLLAELGDDHSREDS